MIGKVITYKEDRGFGFIRPDGGGHDAFFHYTSCEDRIAPDLHERVEFDLEPDPRTGKPRAVRVRPARV